MANLRAGSPRVITTENFLSRYCLRKSSFNSVKCSPRGFYSKSMYAIIGVALTASSRNKLTMVDISASAQKFPGPFELRIIISASVIIAGAALSRGVTMLKARTQITTKHGISILLNVIIPPPNMYIAADLRFGT